MRWLVLSCLVIGALAAPGLSRADDAGQADLDQAVEIRVNASNLQEVGRVVELCESALEKGLGDENKEFAQQILAGALLQRAALLTNAFQSVDLSSQSGQRQAAAMRFQALKDVEKVLELDAEQPQAHLVVAQLEGIPGGNRERARKAADEAVRLAEEDRPLHCQALLLRAGLSESAEDRLKDLNEAVELQPDSATPLRARGLLYFQQGKRDEGLTDLKKALELEPDNAATHELMAAALADAGRGEEALESIDAAIEGGADGPEVYLLRARLNIGLQKLDDALADLDKVIEKRPGFVPALRIRAAVLLESGRETEALLDLEAARDKAGDDPELLAQLGLIYNQTGHIAKALECFDQALAAEGDNWSLRMVRADALLSVGRHADALADYAEAYRLKPDDSGLLNNYAWLLATSPEDNLRDGGRAIELATEACKLTDYKRAHILSTLAASYAEKGDFDKAVEWSTKAVELGEGEMKEQLQKELDSYKGGKPWREKQEKPLDPPAVKPEDSAPEAQPEAEEAPAEDAAPKADDAEEPASPE